MYKSLYNFVADNLFEYLSTLPYYEINEINDDFKTNGWKLESGVRNYNGSVDLSKSMDFL